MVPGSAAASAGHSDLFFRQSIGVPVRNHDDDDDSRDEDERETIEDEEIDPDVQTEAEVTCPYCGEVVQITLDPTGGAAQEYVEDCEICCRPWNLQVNYDEMGAAEVTIEAAER
jgi:hypothetical protein